MASAGAVGQPPPSPFDYTSAGFGPARAPVTVTSMSLASILLADKKSAALARSIKALKAEGFAVRVAHDRAAAEAALADRLPDIVISSHALPGDAHLGLVKAVRTRDASIGCLFVAPRADKATRKKALAAGADQVIGSPAADATLVAAARGLAQVRTLRQQLQVPALGVAPVDPLYDRVTTFYTFERFKEVLFVEVKRARRYGFPVALLLASIESDGALPDLAAREQLWGGLAVAVRGAIRDTDMPVAYGDGNVLVLMPHTDRKGASTVARRILFRVSKGSIQHAGAEIAPRVAIGFSASQASQLVFSEMVREASASLGQARERGGNCVVPSEAA